MTYSIVAVDEATGDIGVCVTTTVAGVGALAPHVSLQCALSTQAYVNVDLGLEVIERTAAGQGVDNALNDALAADKGAEQRQVVAIDWSGNATAFTGSEVLDWSGHLIGVNHAVAGNLLTGPEVLQAMSETFIAQKDDEFVARLIASVDAGLAAGGEVDAEEFKDTVASAAVMVASRKPKGYHNLRVDASLTPVSDLRRVYELAKNSFEALDDFYDGAIEIRPTFWRRVWEPELPS